GLVDKIAAFIARYVKQQRLQVPHDISVLGCGGDDTVAYLYDPPLTSIAANPEEIGRQAFSVLLQRMQERQQAVPLTPRTIRLEPQLMIRDSCAPPRTVRTPPQRPQSATAPPQLSLTVPKRRARTIHWRPEDTVEALEQRFHGGTAPDLRKRWQAFWLLRRGDAQRAVAREVGVTLRTVRNWLSWYQTGGADDVATHRIGGPTRKRCRLTDEQCAQFASLTGQGTLTSIRQAQEWVADAYGLEYTDLGLRKLLNRLGINW
ncbi:MAG TPA: substrate-binding domain-containing protein, partial [Armatimonadota bacterium]